MVNMQKLYDARLHKMKRDIKEAREKERIKYLNKINVAGRPNALELLFESLPKKDKLRI